MLEPEGKRCWTLCYEEFHMDILPCVSNNRYYIEPDLTEIKLTHKLDNGSYIPKYSNPYKYHDWFEERMRVKPLLSRVKCVYLQFLNKKRKRLKFFGLNRFFHKCYLF